MNSEPMINAMLELIKQWGIEGLQAHARLKACGEIAYQYRASAFRKCAEELLAIVKESRSGVAEEVKPCSLCCHNRAWCPSWCSACSEQRKG